MKLVRRGERVQGLAFAEGLDRNAPGCAASRVDARCALRALERRFGPFTPSHEPAPAIQRAAPWIDTVRPTILAAVDAARSWDDLSQRLDQHGIVVKLVERGGRVQGLAFAQGSRPDAPGCGASRIDARCKKAALEQRFGPFPRKQQQERTREATVNSEAQPYKRGRLRERVERQALSDPGWALREAGHIVDHARMRSAYAAYRDRFFGERSDAIDARRNAAWERERAQRQLEAQHRREARRLLRSVARLGTRGIIARQVAYWSIDAVMARRRAQEYGAARVRWEATKIVLASDRALARKEKPMDYRSFVTEKARGGDPSAQRVLDMLTAPRGQDRAAPGSESRPVSLNEVRARLDVIRAEEEARYQRARGERERLQRVVQPPALDEVLAAERKRIEGQIADATQFTDSERARLSQLAEEKRSWNPITRTSAAKGEANLQAAHRSRYAQALAEALREFEGREVPQIAKRVAAEEHRYRQYVAASLALAGEMREARSLLHHRIPRVEQRLSVLERAGVAQLDGDRSTSNASLSQIEVAIEQQYQALPDARRREAERSIRRVERMRDRSRESISMGGR